MSCSSEQGCDGERLVESKSVETTTEAKASSVIGIAELGRGDGYDHLFAIKVTTWVWAGTLGFRYGQGSRVLTPILGF